MSSPPMKVVSDSDIPKSATILLLVIEPTCQLQAERPSVLDRCHCARERSQYVELFNMWAHVDRMRTLGVRSARIDGDVA